MPPLAHVPISNDYCYNSNWLKNLEHPHVLNGAPYQYVEVQKLAAIDDHQTAAIRTCFVVFQPGNKPSRAEQKLRCANVIFGHHHKTSTFVSDQSTHLSRTDGFKDRESTCRNTGTEEGWQKEERKERGRAGKFASHNLQCDDRDVCSAQSEEDLKLKQELELLVERVQDRDPGVQKLALDSLCKEIKSATSSMTSVPKPLKFLRPHYNTLKTFYNGMPESDNKVKPCFKCQQHKKKIAHNAKHTTTFQVENSSGMISFVQKYLADVLSVLSMTMGDDTSRDCLNYKLKGTQGDVGAWGHEYIRYYDLCKLFALYIFVVSVGVNCSLTGASISPLTMWGCWSSII